MKTSQPIYSITLVVIVVGLLLVVSPAIAGYSFKETAADTTWVKPTRTRTATPGVSNTPTQTATAANTSTPTATPDSPSNTPGASFTPWPSAPACAAHDNSTFHTLWDAALGCHYNHEHGEDPFTQVVTDTFPGFDLFSLLCDVEIGHCNPSSPMENTHKHGGFKWQVDFNIPCEVFESAQWCVTNAAIQYHDFGDSSIEMEARIHSALALVKACNPSNPNDCGYLYVAQHVDYGQRVSQYQGDIMPYTEAGGCTSAVGCQPNPVPAYAAPLGPYNTIDRYGTCTGCRPSLQFVVDRRANANGVWTSKNGPDVGPLGSGMLSVLFRVRDMYQLKNDADNSYPFTFGWLCSSNGGATYNPAACRYTNSTARVHEIAGVIPVEWDNLVGFDTNPAVGRITAEGFVTRFGVLNTACTQAGGDCFPVKMVNMFVGKYGAALPGQKISNPNPVSNPSRNIWFCNGVSCSETDAGAAPSGWIGVEN